MVKVGSCRVGSVNRKIFPLTERTLQRDAV